METAQSSESALQITSPDGKMKILHHKLITSPFGLKVVEGAIRNISPDYNLGAELKAEYYDADGAYIDSELCTLKRIDPGQSTAFELSYGGKNRYLVKNSELWVRTLPRIG